MTLLWAIAGVIVLLAAVAVLGILRRLVFFFALAFFGLLALQIHHDPSGSAALIASTGGGLLVAWPVRRFLMGMLV
ncbi:MULTISPECIES: hypothetical protein [Roseobacteraceae]|uniref:hypothetical protein n=1 Tax=Roseobacteraceae TaxID=2854170 RepID=UPI0012FC6C4A|nr:MULTISPECIES: hypothetical protein [Roseobacteraceae]MCA0994174.1 hypothetical protein [Alloyangia pacifica]